MTEMLGLRLAALYSLPPCNLGFCGTKNKNAPKILADFIVGKKIQLTKVRKILENFEASYPYYKLIAQSNKIADPFNYRVVEAYWSGNKLLDKVKINDLKKLILNEFTRPGLLTKKQAEKKISLIPAQVKPHHSFHVLFIGSITGRINLTGKILDLCRIGWGKVMKLKIKNKKLKIKYSPLIVQKNKFLLGGLVEKEIVWDKKLIPMIKIGDAVSFHWSKVCQVLNNKQQRNLLKYTKLALKSFNEQRR